MRKSLQPASPGRSLEHLRPSRTIRRMTKASPEPARFEGFDRSAIPFLHELAAEMNREWFEANKKRYEEVWVAPMTALLASVASGLTRAYGPVKLGAPKL